jgi:hypothetical protein
VCAGEVGGERITGAHADDGITTRRACPSPRACVDSKCRD